MSASRIEVCILGMIFLAACGGAPKTEMVKDPAELGKLAASVEAAPSEDAAKQLAAKGHTEATFKVEVEAIMEDEVKVVEFSKAYKAAK